MPEGSGEKPQFVPKTPEQLRQQVKLTTLANLETGIPLNISGDLKAIDKRQLEEQRRKEGAALEKYEENPLVFPDGQKYIPHQPTVHQYPRYVHALRQLRRVQANEADQRTADLKQDENPTSKSEALQERLAYSPTLGFALVEKIQDTHGKTGRKYKDEDVRTLVKTEEGLEKVVYGLLVDDPEKIFRNFEAVTLVLPREKAIAIIEKAMDFSPENAVWNMSNILKFSPLEQHREIVIKNISRDRGSASYNCLDEPRVAEILTQEEKRGFILQILENTNGGPISSESHHTERFLEQGLITQAEIKTALEKYVTAEPSSALWAVQETAKLLSAEDQKHFQDLVIVSCTDPKHYLDSWRLKQADFLTPEQKVEVVRTRVTADPQVMAKEFSAISEFLPREEVQIWIQAKLAGQSDDLFAQHELVKRLTEDDWLTTEEKQQYVQIIINKDAGIALYSFKNIAPYISEETRLDTLFGLINRAEQRSILSNSNQWLEFVPDNQRKDLLRAVIEKQSGFAYVRPVVDPYNKLQGVFTPDELKHITYRQLELGVENAFYSLDGLRKILGSDAELKAFLDKALQVDPLDFLRNIDDLEYLYDQQELENVVRRAEQDPRGISACLWSIDKWGPKLRSEYVWEVVQRHGDLSAADLLERPGKWIKYAPEQDRIPFYTSLIKADPAVAIYFANERASETAREIEDSGFADGNLSSFFRSLTAEQVVGLGQEDKERFNLAPVTLGEFYKNIGKAQDKAAREALLKNAHDVYKYIGAIRKQNLGGVVEGIRANQQISKSREVDVLGVVYCFAKLKQQGELTENDIENIGTTYEAASEHLLKVMANKLDVQSEITPEMTRRFFSTMETAAPFMLYVLQYGNSEGHRELLQGMFASISEGRFGDWKYKPTEDGLNELKQAKLLPSGLTFEQYSSWTQDSDTSTFESLSSDAGFAASSIREYMIANQAHLGLKTYLSTNSEEGINAVQENLGRIGQKLGNLNRELSQLKKANAPESDLQGLTSQKAELEKERRYYVAERDIIRLSSLRPEEVISGYLLDLKDPKKKVAKIEQTLKFLRDSIPQEDQFVLDNIQGQIDSFQNQSLEKQNLVTTDSSSPRVLIEVGAKPVNSCQHYGHGEYNECLLGYSDPNTKILLIRNENGAPIARSIFRLLATPDGKPALHIEHIYTVVASPAVPRSIYLHAFKKAQELGVSLYTTLEAQNEEGALSSAEAPDGFSLTPVDIELVSEASRAPKVYVDSVGGARSFGQYIIKRLAEIRMS